jgi:hypothetical protein
MVVQLLRREQGLPHRSSSDRDTRFRHHIITSHCKHLCHDLDAVGVMNESQTMPLYAMALVAALMVSHHENR